MLRFFARILLAVPVRAGTIATGALLLAPALIAQNLTGELDGTVHDSTGALVSSATVTVTNVARKQVVRTLTTNSEGVFAVPQLEAGQYSVAVTSPGFKQTIIEAEVHEGQSSTLSFALQAGAVNETVSVTANPLTAQLENAAASTVITGTQVRELSLSSRNFEQLLPLQPGITGPPPGPMDRGNFSASGATNTATFSVNGQGTDQNAYFLDGQDMINHGGNAQVILFPSIESLGEISLLRNTYGAQYGGLGGGVFSNSSRSGSTDFHGGFYDFERSQIFNANQFFNNYGGIARPPIRYHDFGYFLGGPLWIPGGGRSRENTKLFFFGGQQFLRSKSATSESITNLPTLAQRGLSGNNAATFAHPVCTQYQVTNGAITANCLSQTTSIPVSSFDPTAAAYLKDLIDKVPAPNNPADTQGILFSAPGTNNESQVFARVDYAATKKLSTFLRYYYDPFNLVVPNGFQSAKGFPGVGNSTIKTFTHAYLAHGEYTLTDKTVLEGGYGLIINDVRVAVIGLLNQANSPDVRPTLPYQSTLGRIPNLTINGGTAWSATGPNLQHQHTNQVFLNVTHTAGKQTLYYGGSLEIFLYDKTTGTTNSGAYAFTSNSLTFNSSTPACINSPNKSNCTTPFEQAYAQFLLGQVSTFQQTSTDPANATHNIVAEGYVQDDYRPTSRLTINAGMRYFFKQQPRLTSFDQYPKLTFSNFSPTAYNPASAPTIDNMGNICPQGTTCNGGKTAKAYDPNNGLIMAGVNSPFGQTILDQPVLNFAPRFGFAYDYTGNGTGSIRGGYGIFYTQLPNSIYQQISIGNPPNASLLSLSNPTNAAIFGNPASGTPAGTTAPISLTTIDPNLKTPYVEDYDLDIQKQLPFGILADVGYFGNHQVHQLGQIDLNQPLPGAYVGATSIAAGQVTASKSTYLNVVRPFQGYGNIGETASFFYGNYNSLQASFTKHLRGKSLVAVNYTYSKALSNTQGDGASPQNIYNLAAEYGPSAQDRRNVFTANFVYEEPFFQHSEAVVRDLLAGWEVTGIVSLGSGPYFTATTTGQDPAGVGLLAASATASARNNQIADPNVGAPHTRAQWFNAAAFPIAFPTGQITPGNAGVNTILGPGYENLDLSLFKNVDIFRELRCQLRFEGFNVFNHTNFTTINTALGNGSYGQATAAANNRVLQIGAKFQF